VLTIPENAYGVALCLTLLIQQVFRHRQRSFTACLYKVSGREESKLGTSPGVGKGRVVVGRRTPLSLVQALLPSNQEVMSQKDESHMMVPTAPETQLIVVHA
jgi:hypothetical protein